MISTSTPMGINQKSLDEVLELIQKPSYKAPTKKNRLTILQTLFNALGLKLDPDAVLFMLSPQRYKLLVSTAGSGKTTVSQVWVLYIQLLLPLVTGKPCFGERILCLVYNDHNVSQMQNTYNKFVAMINAQKITGLEVSGSISAFTMHSFAKFWITQYPTSFGYEMKGPKRAEALESFESEELFRSGILAVGRKFPLPEDLKPGSLVSLYSMAHNLCLDFTSTEMRKLYPELDAVSDEALNLLMKFYNMSKKQLNKYDFVDMLVHFNQMMETEQVVIQHVHSRYDAIVNDEAQDSTPLMMSILKKISKDKFLVSVCDEDQALYEFNGADVRHVLKFTEYFDDSAIFTMTTNRRCRRKIVDASSKLIERNQYRFGKEILHCKEGGEVTKVYYHTELGMISNIITTLSNMTPEQRNNTIVCYRAKANSYLLTEKLEEANITFNVISGHMPFSHAIYRHVEEVLDAVSNLWDPARHLVLYKCLPIYKQDLYDILGWDDKKKEFQDGRTRMHLRSIEWGKYATRETFMRELNVLLEISKMMKEERMKKYMPDLFEMIQKYYWRNELKRKEEEIDQVMTERASIFFSSNMLYENFITFLDRKRSTLKTRSNAKQGVSVSTFHSLKGLQFNHVIITHLDDNIVPSLDTKMYANGMAQQTTEAERRALFVAMTRAIDDLTMYVNIRNPSAFVQELDDAGVFDEQEEKSNPGSAGPMEVFAKPDSTSEEKDKFEKRVGSIFDLFNQGR